MGTKITSFPLIKKTVTTTTLASCSVSRTRTTSSASTTPSKTSTTMAGTRSTGLVVEKTMVIAYQALVPTWSSARAAKSTVPRGRPGSTSKALTTTSESSVKSTAKYKSISIKKLHMNVKLPSTYNLKVGTFGIFVAWSQIEFKNVQYKYAVDQPLS